MGQFQEVYQVMAGLGQGFKELGKGIAVVSGKDPETEFDKAIGAGLADAARLKDIDPAQANLKINALRQMALDGEKFKAWKIGVGNAFVNARKEGKNTSNQADALKAIIDGTASNKQKNLVSDFIGPTVLSDEGLADVIKQETDLVNLSKKSRKEIITNSINSTMDKFLSSQDGDAPKNMWEYIYQKGNGDPVQMGKIRKMIMGGKGGGGNGSDDDVVSIANDEKAGIDYTQDFVEMDENGNAKLTSHGGKIPSDYFKNIAYPKWVRAHPEAVKRGKGDINYVLNDVLLPNQAIRTEMVTETVPGKVVNWGFDIPETTMTSRKNIETKSTKPVQQSSVKSKPGTAVTNSLGAGKFGKYKFPSGKTYVPISQDEADSMKADGGIKQ